MAELHDVTTRGGFLRRIWFRWKTTLMVLFVGIVLLFGLTHFIQSYVLQKPSPPLSIPTSTFVISGSKLLYYGDESKFDAHPDFDLLLPDLPPPQNYVPITTIEIKWVQISSGPNFTLALSNYAPTLRILHLDNVTIQGHFQPRILPFLEEFYLNQVLQLEQKVKKDSDYNHGPPTLWLSSTLFFVDEYSTDFSTKADIAYRKPINVTVFLNGSIIYMLDPGNKEVRMDISNCTEILTKLPSTFSILTLGRCRDLTVKSIHENVTYLNFHNLHVSNELLSSILRKLKALEEFYVEIPNGQVSLPDLSPKLRILSVSSMNIIPEDNSSAYPNIKEFYLGSGNQSRTPTPQNQSIFGNFGHIFPKIEKVALFDVRDEERYVILKSVLQSQSVKWILIVNFKRVGMDVDNSDSTNIDSVKVRMEAYIFVENMLEKLGLSRDAGDFLVEVDNVKKNRKGREIMPLEKLWYRYKCLGWSRIESWTKFLHVQKIIEGDRSLG